MRRENYPSASEMVRNIADIRVRHKLVLEDGKFKIYRFEMPYFDGWEYWVVNEKGFLWEPADCWDAAREYLGSQEARDYQAENSDHSSTETQSHQ